MTRGGRRPGAGRKPKAEKYEQPINEAEQKIVDRLPQLIDKLVYLAVGGYDQIERKYQPAALVTTGSGEFETPVFPDKKADELVLVERRVSRATPDLKALIYLVDRILGKPTQRQELTGEDGGPIEITPAAITAAQRELAEWQQQRMSEQLSSLNALLMPPMPATPTE